MVLAILVGLAYIPLLDWGILCWGEGRIVRKCKEDTNPITTALALAGAVLIIANMWLVITRIRRTDTQIGIQQQQLEEQQNTNFLNGLALGTDMLYSDNLNKQIASIEYLHTLASTHKDNNKRVEEILNVFCAYIREIPAMGAIAYAEVEVKTREDFLKIKEERQISDRREGTEKASKKYEEAQEKLKEIRKEEEEKKKILQIKTRILVKIASPVEDSKIYHEYREKINLEYADLSKLQFPQIQLPGADLRLANFQLAYLPYANLQDAKLEGHIRYTNLTHTNLQGANLQNTNLKYVNLTSADLSGADLRRNMKFDTPLTTRSQLDCALIHANDNFSSACGTSTIIRVHKQNGTHLFTFGKQKEGEKPFGKDELIERIKKEGIKCIENASCTLFDEFFPGVIEYIEKEF